MTMKTILLCVGLIGSTGAPDNQNPTLKKELSDKMILDLSQVELHENFQDYVVVHFSICENEITIESIEGTHCEVIEAVNGKLTAMEINSNYEENKIYSFKFTFEKH